MRLVSLTIGLVRAQSNCKSSAMNSNRTQLTLHIIRLEHTSPRTTTIYAGSKRSCSKQNHRSSSSSSKLRLTHTRVLHPLPLGPCPVAMVTLLWIIVTSFTRTLTTSLPMGKYHPLIGPTAPLLVMIVQPILALNHFQSSLLTPHWRLDKKVNSAF